MAVMSPTIMIVGDTLLSLGDDGDGAGSVVDVGVGAISVARSGPHGVVFMENLP